ncbi:MAG: hypothetical protein LHV69_01900 [Elusimicrobia bacterium]|nr:hypothetical protein [Candidatus Obscuribacterium magneticum]
MNSKVIRLTSGFVILFCAWALAGSSSNLESSLDIVTRKLAPKIPSLEKVLVLDLQDLRGDVTFLGRYAADELRTKLSDFRQVAAFDREAFTTFLAEKKTVGLTVMDDKNAVEMARQMNARWVAFGTVWAMGKKIYLNVKLASVEKGVIVCGVSEVAKKDGRMVYLLDEKASASVMTMKDEEKKMEEAVLERVRQKQLKDSGKL